VAPNANVLLGFLAAALLVVVVGDGHEPGGYDYEYKQDVKVTNGNHKTICFGLFCFVFYCFVLVVFLFCFVLFLLGLVSFYLVLLCLLFLFCYA
jgi:hypothetical protein